MAELLKDYERGMESTTELIRDHAVGNPLFSHSAILLTVLSIKPQFVLRRSTKIIIRS
jgi:hypothetical protein